MSIFSLFFFSFHLHAQFSESPDNQTLSVLTYKPTIDDDGKYLTCRAENEKIEGSMIEDRWLLTVHCKYFFVFFCIW